MKQLLLDIAPAPVPALDNFVPGRNTELLATLASLLDGSCAERFLYMWGEPGAGKTHLLKAAAGPADALFLACKPGLALPVDAAQLRLVVVDDVERLDAAGQIALFNLYNALRAGQGILLASGPCAPAQLPLRPDLKTRLGWGLILRVHALSDEEKMQALELRAHELGFDFSREAARYLLSHWRRDMPALLAALEALDRYSLETKRPVTLPLLRDLVGVLRQVPPAEPTFNA